MDAAILTSWSTITVLATPLAVVAIVENVSKIRALRPYKFPIVVLIGVAFGASYTLWGELSIFKNIVTFLLLALSGAGLVDLKTLKKTTAGTIDALK